MSDHGNKYNNAGTVRSPAVSNYNRSRSALRTRRSRKTPIRGSATAWAGSARPSD